MKCEYCEMAEQQRNLIISEQDVVIAMPESALAAGQVAIFPRRHFTIMEMVPEDIMQKCLILANKAGISIFEALGCQGTNVLVQNGVSAGQKVPHFSLAVIPRRENDGINLQWKTQQLLEEEMEQAFSALRKALQQPQGMRSPDENPAGGESGGRPAAGKAVGNEAAGSQPGKGSNYLLKSLRRLP